MELYKTAAAPGGLSYEELKEAVHSSLKGRSPRRVLLIPPDYTRLHSHAGFLTNLYYHALTERSSSVEILPALGTHAPVSAHQRRVMFGDIPSDRFLIHNWRSDVVRLGEVPGDYISGITEGLWRESVSVELNRRILDPSYDLIISLGQVVPHEVIGMSNHAKNLFVGTGGSAMIHQSHMIGAVYGMERMMGRDHTPVRKIFDYGCETFLKDLPLLWVLTVTTLRPKDEKEAALPKEKIAEAEKTGYLGDQVITNGLFIGEGRECLTKAIKLAQEKNIDFVEQGVRKCVVYLDPEEFQSTWLGNKAIYRTRMMMADGGELLILAPGVRRFGEDEEVDRLIRSYGYRGREEILKAFSGPGNKALRENMGVAAHLIHGSSEGRFSITYAAPQMARKEIEGAGFLSADYDEAIRRYDPAKLHYGAQTIEGEEIFYIPNPALGLWIDRSRFETPQS